MSETWAKIWAALRDEGVGIHPRFQATKTLDALLPARDAGASRAGLFALAGFEVGAGTELEGWPHVTGRSLGGKLRIGRDCLLGPECVLDLSDLLTIGDGVTLGPGTMILTSTHELASPHHRAGKIITSPVVIGDGAWLGARCVILPGVNIGAGVVVEPGAVANKDVPAHTRVGGNPAVKRDLLSNDGR